MMSLEARVLSVLGPWRQAPAWRLAYSGGLDSTVLLHLLARIAQRETLPPLSAFHVHHGLQAVADAWPTHCQQACERLGIPLEVLRVTVGTGASVERAARDARYAALAEKVEEGDVLLMAQHRDDQAETLLFRLMRGAGVRGLASMAASRPLGRGNLVRPLLGVAREELAAYARAEGLSWVEDPSNADIHFARNFLRQTILPSLQAHWPAASQNIARCAEHLAEAESLLEDLARLDLATATAGAPLPWLNLPSLDLSALQALSPARQRNALRHWLAPLTRLPDSNHWSGWEDLRDAARDAQPMWCLADGQLHRADGRLWWLAGPWLDIPPIGLPWKDPSRPLALPCNGRLEFIGTAPAGVQAVAYRRGGEVFEVAGRGRRDLKRLLNEARLPGFVRGRLPLLLCDDRLLAVANLPGLDGPHDGAWRLHWTPPTNAQGLSW